MPSSLSLALFLSLVALVYTIIALMIFRHGGSQKGPALIYRNDSTTLFDY